MTIISNNNNNINNNINNNNNNNMNTNNCMLTFIANVMFICMFIY